MNVDTLVDVIGDLALIAVGLVVGLLILRYRKRGQR